jgi:hypothetical protein
VNLRWTFPLRTFLLYAPLLQSLAAADDDALQRLGSASRELNEGYWSTLASSQFCIGQTSGEDKAHFQKISAQWRSKNMEVIDRVRKQELALLGFDEDDELKRRLEGAWLRFATGVVEGREQYMRTLPKEDVPRVCRQTHETMASGKLDLVQKYSQAYGRLVAVEAERGGAVRP